MAFRDDLEAARERIDTLERHAAVHREKQRSARASEPPFAIVSVALALVVLAMSAGLFVLWRRAEAAEAQAAEWRRLEGETAFQLQETIGRLIEAQRHAVPVGAGIALVPQSRWDARVTERIGDAPAHLDETCAVRMGPQADLGADDACELYITCDEVALYPRGGESAGVRCGPSRADTVDPLGTSHHTRRALGTSDALRIDDGPDGTWSLLLQRLDP